MNNIHVTMTIFYALKCMPSNIRKELSIVLIWSNSKEASYLGNVSYVKSLERLWVREIYLIRSPESSYTALRLKIQK
jgi:hypothetical protein